MRIRLFINTGYPMAKHERFVEVPDDELEGLTDEQREAVFDEYAQDFMAEKIEWGWESNA